MDRLNGMKGSAKDRAPNCRSLFAQFSLDSGKRGAAHSRRIHLLIVSIPVQDGGTVAPDSVSTANHPYDVLSNTSPDLSHMLPQFSSLIPCCPPALLRAQQVVNNQAQKRYAL